MMGIGFEGENCKEQISDDGCDEDEGFVRGIRKYANLSALSGSYSPMATGVSSKFSTSLQPHLSYQFPPTSERQQNGEVTSSTRKQSVKKGFGKSLQPSKGKGKNLQKFGSKERIDVGGSLNLLADAIRMLEVEGEEDEDQCWVDDGKELLQSHHGHESSSTCNPVNIVNKDDERDPFLVPSRRRRLSALPAKFSDSILQPWK